MAARRLLSSSLTGAKHAPADPKSLNWSTLGFAYVPTKTMVVADWVDGKWREPVSAEEPYLRIHALSNVRSNLLLPISACSLLYSIGTN